MYATRRFRYCPVCGSSRFEANGPKSLRCSDCQFELFVNASAAYVALIYDDQGRLLVVRRRCEPARGTLDLPGGFADAGETAETGVAREVKEETGLDVTAVRYLFSLPNIYRYSGIDIPTLDLFFACEVSDIATLHAGDDAAEVLWLRPDQLRPADFGLASIRQAVEKLKLAAEEHGGTRN